METGSGTITTPNPPPIDTKTHVCSNPLCKDTSKSSWKIELKGMSTLVEKVFEINIVF